MTKTQPQPVTIVCGSDTPIGAALVARLLGTGTAVVAFDFASAQPTGVRLSLHGDLLAEETWAEFAEALRTQGLTPVALVSALQASDASLQTLQLSQEQWDHVLNHNLRSAYLACKHCMPLMEPDGGAIVLLSQVYGEWDVRADGVAQGAGDAGLRALARTLALNGGPLGVRVNTVAYGLLADPEQVAQESGLRAAVGRIPLGRATSPNDVVDAIEFLLSPDASYLTGSTLVVDGGQSLQSWSNAPDAPGYPQPD